MTLFLGLVIGVTLGITITLLANRRANRIREDRARLAERRAADAERLAELGSLTSGLAHEIKNPLSTVVLNAQLVEEAIRDLEASEDETAGSLFGGHVVAVLTSPSFAGDAYCCMRRP